MSRCLIRVENDTATNDIDAARRAADAAQSERRAAVSRARARLLAGQSPTAVLDELALGMYLTGHLEAASAARRHARHTEMEAGVLGALLELTGGKR